MELHRILVCTFLLLQQAVTPTLAVCTTVISNGNTLITFDTCVDLESEGASLSWSLLQSNNTLSVAYSDSALSADGWIGWGINFEGTTMVGTNALIAFQTPSGSTVLTYKLTADIYNNPSVPLTNSPTELQVLESSALISGTSFTIFATLQLSPDQTILNHVWNRGPSVSGLVPAPHSTSDNFLKGMETIDMRTGGITATGQSPHQKLKNVHGVLNAVSWGLLLPIGGMTARYLRSFKFADLAWFYIHVFCQCTGYALGVVGWSIGLRLGSYSKGVVQQQHRNVGISLFVLATVQVTALFFRPHKEQKYRKYWNVYHHSLGYAIILLAIINIFKGFNILAPPERYKSAYIAVIAILGCVSLVLEAASWIFWWRERVRESRGADGHRIPKTEPGNGGANPGSRNGGVHPDARSSRPRWDDNVL